MPSPRSVARNLALAFAGSAWFVLPARAEPPLHVDDAGTLGKGGVKIEGAASRDGKTRGGELLFGFAPVEGVEIGLSVARAADRALDPATRLAGTGIGLKWVPLQNETGWSLGARLDYARTRADERATQERSSEREISLAGLATHRFDNGQVLHLNLGATRTKASATSETVGTWGLGYEIPLAERLQLVAEVFGETRGGADKALGLRYEVLEGCKISGAIGRGNGRGFGQVGFAWEF